mgnify:CR=1 FL=1
MTVKNNCDYLIPNLKPNLAKALYAIGSTLVLYLSCLIFFIFNTSGLGLDSILIFLVLTGTQLRLFMIGHDVGHQLVFKHRWMNDFCRILIGSILGAPIVCWSIGHHYHHKFNGNLTIYKGPMLIISTQEYQHLSVHDQLIYRVSRHPFLMIVTSVIRYFVVPRLRLFSEAFGYIKSYQSYNPMIQCDLILQSSSIDVDKPEMIDTSFCSLLFIIFLASLFYASPYIVLIYIFGLMFSTYIADLIFHMHHNFEGSYASIGFLWNRDQANYKGTANIKMPKIMRWFTANIGYHQAHHIWPQIPFYWLEEASNNIKKDESYNEISWIDVFETTKFIVWDIKNSTYRKLNS